MVRRGGFGKQPPLRLQSQHCRSASMTQAKLQEQASSYGQLLRWYLEFSNLIDRGTL